MLDLPKGSPQTFSLPANVTTLASRHGRLTRNHTYYMQLQVPNFPSHCESKTPSPCILWYRAAIVMTRRRVVRLSGRCDPIIVTVHLPCPYKQSLRSSTYAQIRGLYRPFVGYVTTYLHRTIPTPCSALVAGSLNSEQFRSSRP